MDYLIVGAGALGTLLAHSLERAGLGVRLVDLDEHRRSRLATAGVAFHGYRQAPAVTLDCRSWEDLRETHDVALVCVKPWELEAALADLARHQPHLPAIVSCVGGLAQMGQVAAWPAEVMFAVVNSEVRLRDDGELETGFHNFIWLGNLGRTLTPLMEEVQRDLSWAAPTFTSKVIEGIVWGKALFSLEAGLAALARTAPATFFVDPEARAAARRVVVEALAVAERYGLAAVGFDFFDPPLYRAAGTGERRTLDIWIHHAWQRHEQFRFGLEYEFPALTGLTWSLAPDNPREELTALLEELREAASRVGVATLALDACAEMFAQAKGGRAIAPAALSALAVPEFMEVPA